jgi:adenine phosphoribosyltransferase
VRKRGKLPYKTDSVTYDLEYGTDTLEIHHGAISKEEKVLLADDLLATGGTMAAVRKLVEKQGAQILECCFIIELEFLKGRQKLEGLDIHSLIQY